MDQDYDVWWHSANDGFHAEVYSVSSRLLYFSGRSKAVLIFESVPGYWVAKDVSDVAQDLGMRLLRMVEASRDSKSRHIDVW